MRLLFNLSGRGDGSLWAICNRLVAVDLPYLATWHTFGAALELEGRSMVLIEWIELRMLDLEHNRLREVLLREIERQPVPRTV